MAIIIFAGFDIVIVMLWVIGFAAGGPLSAIHRFWYVELPLLFLVVPVLSLTIELALKGRRIRPGWREFLDWLLVLPLLVNLLGFVGYAFMSGGGM